MVRACNGCGTLHDDPLDCPGEVPATGPERRSAERDILTARGYEKVGVLVARSRDQWRARIVSHPNVLWTVPGGRSSLKFLGATSQEAEANALSFIAGHDGARPAERLDSASSPRPQPAPRASAPSAVPAATCASRRKRVRFAVRYGQARAGELGTTVNVSPDGIFIAAPAPLEPGTPLRVHVETCGGTVELRGIVLWRRMSPDRGGPPGMGVKLLYPPAVWEGLVASLP